MAIEYRTCLYCGKEWRTGTMDPNRYCSVGCWAEDLHESSKLNTAKKEDAADRSCVVDEPVP